MGTCEIPFHYTYYVAPMLKCSLVKGFHNTGLINLRLFFPMLSIGREAFPKGSVVMSLQASC